jgi:hypothetical protein
MSRLSTAGLRIAFVGLLLTTGRQVGAQNTNTSDASDYVVKAGFIYNFAKLVEWPTAALGHSGSPIVIAVLGNDSFADVLDNVVAGKKIDDRAFVVKRVQWKDFKGCGCHMLFVAAQESAHTDEVIQTVKNTSVLTIAEAPNFAKRGGMINFTRQDSTVRFEANVDAAKQAGLTISSRLLSLARIVQTSMTSR